MNDEMLALLQEHNRLWLAERGLIPEGKVARVTVEFVQPQNVEVVVSEDSESIQQVSDEKALMSIIKQIRHGAVRTQISLEKLGVKTLSQVKTLDPERLLKMSYFGPKLFLQFAELLRKEGIDCPITRYVPQKTKQEMEQPLLVVRELSIMDWKKIWSLRWDERQFIAIGLLQKGANRSVRIGKLLPPTVYGLSSGAQLNSINHMFRKNGLPYRLKIGKIPFSGIRDHRLVQIAVLSK